MLSSSPVSLRVLTRRPTDQSTWSQRRDQQGTRLDTSATASPNDPLAEELRKAEEENCENVKVLLSRSLYLREVDMVEGEVEEEGPCALLQNELLSEVGVPGDCHAQAPADLTSQ